MRAVTLVVALAACSGDEVVDSEWTYNHQRGSYPLIVNPTVNTLDQVGTPTLGTYREGVFARYRYYGDLIDFVEEDGIVWLPNNDVVPPTSGGDPTTLFAPDRTTSAMAAIPRLNGVAVLPVAFRGDALELIAEYRIALHEELATASAWVITKHYTRDDINFYLGLDGAVVKFNAGEFPAGLVVTGKHVRVFTEERGSVNGETVLGDLTLSGEDAVVYGPTINGDLRVTAPGAQVTFTRVRGTVDIAAPRATLIRNQLCGGASARGGELRALDNKGLAPLDDAGGGC